MFTGIIETLGTVTQLKREKGNLHITIRSTISDSLKIDQSVAHNGVCLTVVAHEGDTHTVTAIQETLLKTNLNNWQVGEVVNLERCMTANARVDGHFVQGHVDQTATCVNIAEADGSWYFTFAYQPTDNSILVNKGSICIDGTSLTVVNPVENRFSVAIIPYTYEHTVFQQYKVGSVVNLEFDMLGKYITKLFKLYLPRLQQSI